MIIVAKQLGCPFAGNIVLPALISASFIISLVFHNKNSRCPNHRKLNTECMNPKVNYSLQHSILVFIYLADITFITRIPSNADDSL